MERPNIYHYESAKRFLLDSVDYLQKENTQFSMRKWAREMGMASNSLLVMILQNKRSLTLKQVPYFAKGLKLSTPERMYFQALIQLESARSGEEAQLCQVWLSGLRPTSEKRIREVDEYLAISHWVHMAILAMSETKNFTGSPEKICERLEGRATLAEVRSAIARLLDIGLIREEGGTFVCTYQRITTTDDVSVRGAREYHRQVANIAAEAILTEPLQEREFQSFAVAVKYDRLPLAKEMIRKFRTQFYEAMTSGEAGDGVYQMNMHFFRLTESPSKMVSIEDAGAGKQIHRGLNNPPEVKRMEITP